MTKISFVKFIFIFQYQLVVYLQVIFVLKTSLFIQHIRQHTSFVFLKILGILRIRFMRISHSSFIIIQLIGLITCWQIKSTVKINLRRQICGNQPFFSSFILVIKWFYTVPSISISCSPDTNNFENQTLAPQIPL